MASQKILNDTIKLPSRNKRKYKEHDTNNTNELPSQNKRKYKEHNDDFNIPQQETPKIFEGVKTTTEFNHNIIQLLQEKYLKEIDSLNIQFESQLMNIKSNQFQQVLNFHQNTKEKQSKNNKILENNYLYRMIISNHMTENTQFQNNTKKIIQKTNEKFENEFFRITGNKFF